MKATFNLATKELVVTGESIETLTTIADEWEDYWDSVKDINTGEPLYDINLYFDDFANDGGDESNPANYQAQYVNLIKNEDGSYSVGKDYQSLELEVIAK